VDLATGDTARQLLTADQTGAFKLSLPLGRDYAAYVDHKGYLFNSRNFSLKNLGGNTQYYDLTIVLSKIKADEVIRLDNIFFAFDQATLLPESNVELEKLLAFLKQNSRLKTELGGHTDDRGTEAYNLKLSLQRAEAVRNWLVERGIAPDRISARGYGLHKPLAPNTTDEGRALNRRTELKIIGE
jgi:outer membrane protein OmpA-like peptidoglycan-associated protein